MPSDSPEPRALVAAEISPTLPPNSASAIVWRKPHHERESRDVMPQTMIVASGATDGGQTSSAAGANANFGGQIAPSTAAFADAGAADVTHIARQVSRAIARELRIDRERRGRTR